MTKRVLATLLLLTAITTTWASSRQADSVLRAIMPQDVYHTVIQADRQQREGSTEEAQRLYYDAIRRLEALEGDYSRAISRCYFQIATDMLNLGDREGMRSVLGRYDRLRQGRNSYVDYDYYSILSTALTLEIDSDNVDPKLRDSMLLSMKRAIGAMQNIDVSEEINPVWNYYNVAVVYDLYFAPPMLDSIEVYLDRAEQINESHNGYDRKIADESRISIDDMRARLYLYRGEYRKAERQMVQVLAMLDEVDKVSPNTVVTERGEAYSFMVKLYETTGQTAEALEYQKLLTDNNMRRYDIDKTEAIHVISEQYEVEKKEQQIAALEEHNSQMQRLIVLLTVMIVLASGAAILILVVRRLRRENVEQKVYERVLVNEMVNEESNDKNMVGNGIQVIIDRLRIAVSTSHLTEEQKQLYGEKLGAVSVESLTALFATAREPLTAIDKKYILCFVAGIPIQGIADLFNIETSSVYTVRYRIRKKFDTGTMF